MRKPVAGHPQNTATPRRRRACRVAATTAVAALALAGPLSALPAPAVAQPAASGAAASDYLIGPGDTLQVFVWKNPELSAEVPVRPDGKITTPLVQDMQAQGKTSTELARNIQGALAGYVQDPVVTVLVKGFAAPGNSAAIRVIGAAVTPKTVPYRSGMTALDALIDVGGLTNFANGNGAVLLRRENGGYRTYKLRLKDLVKSGKLKANMTLQPGDIIRIPERWF
jgi:polysaccharide export outer membrane protein